MKDVPPRYRSMVFRCLPACFIVMGALSSCQPFVPKPVALETGYNSFSTRSLEESIKHAGRKVPAVWGFDDLAVVADQAKDDVRLARAQAETARAALITAGAKPNPTIGFSPERAIKGESGISPWVLGFSLDIPFETGGKRNHRLTKAQADAQVASLHAVEVAWAARSALRKAWIEFNGAHRRSTLLAEQLKVQEDALHSMEAQLQAGERGKPELMQSRLLLNQTKLLAATATKQLEEAKADIAVALGLPQSALGKASFDFSSFEKLPSVPSGKLLQRTAALQRPDVLSALASYASAESALRLEVAKQYPDIHLGPGYQFDQGANKWALGVNFTLPVFDRNKGPMAEAEAKRSEAGIGVEAAQAKAAGEVERAIVSYRACLKRQQAAEELVADQRKQLESADALAKAGETDRTMVLSAKVELTAAQLGLLDALIESQQSLGALEDALMHSLPR